MTLSKTNKSKGAYISTPLLLFYLILVTSCASSEPKPTVTDPENTPTQISENHTMVYSGNGKKRYRMYAPQIKRFELAKEPYTLYPKGIKVELFSDSLTNTIESDLVADYAHYNEKQGLWEAKGNVVGNNYSGNRKLQTDQLFWNEATGKIYTDKRAVVHDGESIYVGTGFETDQNFDAWRFNHAAGKIAIQPDSLQTTTSEKDTVAMEPIAGR